MTNRRLRSANWRLRWKKGAYTLNQCGGSRYFERSIRFDIVTRCAQQRQFRLALTVLVMPVGYALKKVEDRRV